MTDNGDKMVAIDHISEHTVRLSSGRFWLPAVWSEDDNELRAHLVAELGRPVPSGYMSEEQGWEIDPEDYGIDS